MTSNDWFGQTGVMKIKNEWNMEDSNTENYLDSLHETMGTDNSLESIPFEILPLSFAYHPGILVTFLGDPLIL